MDLHRSIGSKLSVNASQVAAPSLSRALGDAINARGFYDAHCQIPVAHLRNEYRDIRDALEEARVKHDFLTVDRLEIDIARIPQETMWREKLYHNLVTDVGANNMLDNHLSAAGLTTTWYMLLISSVGYSAIVAGDTASSHAGWTEFVGYSNANRPTASWNSAAARAKATASGLVFNINASGTVKGSGLISNNTKGGTTGVLFSGGLFSGGDQPVIDTNTLTVNYTLNA